ncbi:MAG: VOC family protein [Gemmatimonadaceae bacterium]
MHRTPGDFCWINVITPDPDGDRAFFTAVLDWRYAEIPGMGWRILVDGKQAGGIFPNHTPDGRVFPPGIGVMVQVADATASAERMRALGGRAAPPMAIGPNGIMVDAADPDGAGIDLWQSGAEASAQHDLTAHGAPFWYELVSHDVARSAAFYHELFGWTTVPQPMPDFTYTVLQHAGRSIAGIMPYLPHMPSFPPFWATYMQVRDVDAAVAAAVQAGGTICMDATELPTVGRLAGIVSPRGVMFYVMGPQPTAIA